MPYPSGVELSVFLVASGLFADPPTKAQNLMDLDSAMSAAVAEWERLTRYTPFLSTGVASPRTFDAPGCSLLPLNGGLLSLTSLTINNTAYTVNQQFVLSPPDAADNGLPYTSIDFGGGGGGNYGDWGFGFGAGSMVGLGNLGTGRRSIVVTGVWGYCLALPTDVKRALLHRGAIELAPDLTHAVTGGVVMRKEADETVQYSAHTFAGQVMSWQSNFDKAVARYSLPPSFGL